jgi:sulfatase modifying factor 1
MDQPRDLRALATLAACALAACIPGALTLAAGDDGGLGDSGSSGGDSGSSGGDSGSSSGGAMDSSATEGGGDAGCTPGAKRCSGSGAETCTNGGTWGSAVACKGSTPFCVNGGCSTEPPSCVAGGAGMTGCGASSESCCTSLAVSGGMYDRTYVNSGSGPTGEADPATVTSFRLDKYEVTVGRFRQFVSAWNGGAGYVPPAGSGKHTHLNVGQGLASSGSAGAYEPGWVATDDGNVAPTDANLACAQPSAGYATWTTLPGSNESLPINCVSWWDAYAFCIWDGGFLPSEAEWEYAAAGGSQQLEYPWGGMPPVSSNQYAIYGCNYPSPGTCTGVANIAPVGTATLGAGLWGQFDLAGNVWEWNLDWFATYVPSIDGAYLTTATTRVLRGGVFYGVASTLLPPSRDDKAPGNRVYFIGLRCARTP